MYKVYFVIILIFILYQNVMCQDTMCQRKSNRLNFVVHARKYGREASEFDILTEDNYIIKLFNIRGGEGKRPVLLMHGFSDSADTFIARGNKSLSLALDDAGYDVWIGNVRGNRYGRRHKYLNPDLDNKFWDYSFHDMALYDLPALIDFVLMKTGRTKLSAVGHSQGNTIFFLLGILRPEYNEKINILLAMAPVCYLSNLNNITSNFFKSFAFLHEFLKYTRTEEIIGDNTPLRAFYDGFCQSKNGYTLCMTGFWFLLMGDDPTEVEPEFFKQATDYFPAGTSRKNFQHTAQVSETGKFTQYDYGSPTENFNRYNNSEPPSYDLSKVTMRTAFIIGKNDLITPEVNVKRLRDELQNVVDNHYVKYEKANHIDFIWGKHMYKYLFPYIFSMLEKY